MDLQRLARHLTRLPVRPLQLHGQRRQLPSERHGVRTVYEIGPFRLDPEAGVLTHAGIPMALGARAVAVLAALVKQANEYVRKESILDAAWPGVVVEESNLAVQISAIRRVFAKAPGGEQWVETLPRRGYRFVGPVTELREPRGATGGRQRSNLPEPLTSFIGRERELVEIKRLLSGKRLLSLIGVGGIGKTRLALQLAHEVMDAYRDGVWLIELGSISDPLLVPTSVAQVLGVQEQTGTPLAATLCAHLKTRQLLLILDNCEHLLDACAGLADAVLRSAAEPTIVATSREPLHVAGEQAYTLQSLSLPEPSASAEAVRRSEAVQLFVERAQRQLPDFELTAARAPAVAGLCIHLDGIPLALELAAARIRSLSIEQINARLNDRFRLLTSGPHTALPRQQTLRATLDWSYDLLRHSEQQLLQRLSIFAGGWTLEAAEQVCAGDGVEDQDVLDLLTSLCDKSLVMVEQSDAHSRYRLLETVRQYARERLLESGDGETVRQRHRDCFVTLAEEAAPKLIGAEKAAWLQRLEEEHENLRAGLQWSLAEAGSVAGLRLCGALWRFWLTRGYLSEGRAWCVQVLGKVGAEERTPERAQALHAAGVLAFWQADYPDAHAKNEESLAIRRQLGDRKGMAVSLNNLGNVAAVQGEFASARMLYEECLVIWRELGDRWGTAASLNNLGNVNLDQSNFDTAKALYEESLAISRELGELGGISSVLISLGTVACEQGDYPTGRKLFEQGLVIQRELGDRLGIAASLNGLAAVTAAFSRSPRAACIWGAGERLRAELGSPMMPSERQRHDRRVAAARVAFGDDASFDRAWQEGRALTLENAIELALEKTVER